MLAAVAGVTNPLDAGVEHVVVVDVLIGNMPMSDRSATPAAAGELTSSPPAFQAAQAVG